MTAPVERTDTVESVTTATDGAQAAPIALGPVTPDAPHRRIEKIRNAGNRLKRTFFGPGKSPADGS